MGATEASGLGHLLSSSGAHALVPSQALIPAQNPLRLPGAVTAEVIPACSPGGSQGGHLLTPAASRPAQAAIQPGVALVGTATWRGLPSSLSRASRSHAGTQLIGSHVSPAPLGSPIPHNSERGCLLPEPTLRAQRMGMEAEPTWLEAPFSRWHEPGNSRAPLLL